MSRPKGAQPAKTNQISQQARQAELARQLGQGPQEAGPGIQVHLIRPSCHRATMSKFLPVHVLFIRYDIGFGITWLTRFLQQLLKYFFGGSYLVIFIKPNVFILESFVFIFCVCV